MENNVYDIKKIKYTFSVFNVMELKPGPTENYEIGLDGMFKFYITENGSRKYRNLKKIQVSEEQVKQFFAELRDILENAKYEYERIDDTARDIRITYSDRHYEVLTTDTETEDGRSIEKAVWDFLHSIDI